MFLTAFHLPGGVTVSLPMVFLCCLLVGLAGFIDASAGGGGLISLPTYLFIGLPSHLAYGCNKFSSACGTTFAALKFFRSGALDIQAACIAAVSSFLGSTLASRMAMLLPDDFFKKLILFAVPIAAAVILAKRNVPDEDTSDRLPAVRKMVLAALIGFFIGGYDGLVGPGTGTFAILAFSSLMGYSLRNASGNAKLLNLASNYASLVTVFLSGSILLPLAVPCAVCNIIGSVIGSRLAIKNGGRFIRPMLLVVLSLLLVKLASDIFF